MTQAEADDADPTRRTPGIGETQEVIEHYLEAVGRGQWAQLPALYAEDALVTHPLDSGQAALKGRQALRAHFAALQAMGLQVRACDVVFHQTLDPEVIVVEFAYLGTAGSSRGPVARRNIFVMTVRDGLIVESRDYHGDSGEA